MESKTLIEILQAIKCGDCPAATRDYLPMIFVEYKSFDFDREKRIRSIEAKLAENGDVDEFNKSMEHEAMSGTPNFEMILSRGTAARIANGYPCKEKFNYDGVASFSLMLVSDALEMLQDVPAESEDLAEIFIAKYFERVELVNDCY